MSIDPNEMVQILSNALRDNVGVDTVTTDGTSVKYTDRSKIMSELVYWQRQAARARVSRYRRGPFRNINLGSAW